MSAGAEDLAPLFTDRYGGGPGGFGASDSEARTHQGIVTAWNSTTGENTISVAGATLVNIPAIAIADSIMLTVGDPVVLLKVKSQWFIAGRIAPPGGGAALQIRGGEVPTAETTTSLTYTNLATVGPTLTNVYIGSSRRCLVFVHGRLTCTAGFGAEMGFEVSGASTISATAGASVYLQTDSSSAVRYDGMNVDVLTAADGLNQGLNTFQAKYRADVGGTADFRSRKLVVFPF